MAAQGLLKQTQRCSSHASIRQSHTSGPSLTRGEVMFETPAIENGRRTFISRPPGQN
jgi:hypothetical protein